MTHRVILASASPRRAELLAQLGVCFDVLPQAIDETPKSGEKATELSLRLADAKAQSALAECRRCRGASPRFRHRGECR